MSDGNSGGCGITYEMRLCMLCLVRGYTRGLTNFRLRYQAPESEVGKFDDIVFDEGDEIYQVLQLKHKEKGGQISINSSHLFHENFSTHYNLLKYVYSYFGTLKDKVKMAVVVTPVDCRTMSNNQLKLLANRQGWFQTLRFIQLRTLTPEENAIFDTSSTFSDAKCYKFDNDPNIIDILKRQSVTVSKELRQKLEEQKQTTPNKKYENQQEQLRKNYEAIANFLEKISDDDIQEALQHIVYAVRQPNDMELKEIIKNEIQDYFKLQNVDTVYNALENEIIKWCNHKLQFIHEVPTSNPHEIYFRDAEIFFQKIVKKVSFGNFVTTSSFTGRKYELNLIRQKLEETHNFIVSQSVTINGLGGIGKTELTKQFIKEFGQSDFYGRVIWIEAESDESVNKSFRALAEKIDIQDRKNKLTTTIIDQIFDYFYGVKVLFVFDNFDNYKVAVKVVDRGRLDARALRMLSREVSTLECVHHPFILRLFEVVETLGRVHLVTEWIRGGELYHRITQGGPLPEILAAKLYRQLLLAVKHMHNLGFVHRDIKAENVLLVAEDRIKLADFGFSTQLVNGPWQHLDTFCGSPPYAAPELFSDDHYIGGPVDIWALGVLLYFMVVGNMPFRAPTVPALRSAVLKGDYTLPPQLTLPCNRLIQRMLVHTPSRRPTVDQLIESQWLTSPNLLKELHDYQVALNAPRINRRKSLWFPARDRSIHRQNSKKDRQNGFARPCGPINCSTKRGGSILAENYLHPIEQFRVHNPTEIPAINPKRGGLFSANMKKKIGPIDNLESTKSLQSSGKRSNSCSSSNNKSSFDAKSTEFLKDTGNNNGSLTPTTNASTPNNPTQQNTTSAFSLKTKFEDADFSDEQKGFVMLPTQTKDVIELDDIEKNARKILNNLGISDELLCQAVPSGPRSDIIGAYRIIVHRLQKQAYIVKQAETMVVEEPIKPKNHRKTCVIL